MKSPIHAGNGIILNSRICEKPIEILLYLIIPVKENPTHSIVLSRDLCIIQLLYMS